MRKKSFNWAGILLIVVYLFVLLLFAWGIYHCVTFPQSAIVKFFNAGVQGAVVALSLFGGFILIFGGIFVRLFYKKFSIKTIFKDCPELKEPVKIVSKALGVNHVKVPRTAHSTIISNVFFIVCEFQDGTRKNFRVKDINVYNTILENDAGMLMYKESGKHTLFIDFQRQL